MAKSITTVTLNGSDEAENVKIFEIIWTSL
jgi:hypothetical protein